MNYGVNSNALYVDGIMTLLPATQKSTTEIKRQSHEKNQATEEDKMKSCNISNSCIISK